MGIIDKIKGSKTKTIVASKEVAGVAAVSEKKSDKKSGLESALILRPYVTEKSAILSAQNMYVFMVEKKANRIQIATAIKAMYGVSPVSVNVQNVRGKVVRRGRIEGKRKSWKKAIVILPKGKTLNVYEGV